jgi:hypothetical protein
MTSRRVDPDLEAFRHHLSVFGVAPGPLLLSAYVVANVESPIAAAFSGRSKRTLDHA